MDKILIVDDERDIVDLLERYFQRQGYLTLTARDGAAAVEQAAKKPDAILLDVNMPGMDGLEVCRRIREYVACPILFLTARVEDADKVRGLRRGRRRLRRQAVFRSRSSARAWPRTFAASDGASPRPTCDSMAISPSTIPSGR